MKLVGGRWALLLLAAFLAVGCAADRGDNSGGPPPGADGSAGTGGASGSGGGVQGMGGFGSGGASGTGGVGQDASGDAPINADGGQQDASSDAPAGCFLEMTPVSARSFGEPVERPSGAFRVRADATPPRQTDTWTWQVTVAPDSAPVATQRVGDASNVVDFPTARNGTYTVEARIPARPECAAVKRELRIIEPRPAAFTFRVFPPATLPAPIQEIRLTREELAARDLTLAGTAEFQEYFITPFDDTAKPLPSYLQITSAGSTLALEGNTSRGAVSVLLLRKQLYDLLVIPAGDFAPRVFSGVPGTLTTLTLDAGTAVSGQALDSQDRPVVDARVVLRNGARPSTIGISKSDGRFSLRTRDGVLSAEIVAPVSSGLPDARVTAAAGLVVAPSSAELTLTMRWVRIPAAALKVVVRTTDGAAPVAGATVRAELTTPIAAGRLTVHVSGTAPGSDVGMTASGSRVAEASSDATGTVTFPSLPQGPYRITVIPPAGVDGDGPAVTTATVDLGAAGINRTVDLARKVVLSGVLLPAAATRGVHLTAIDTGNDMVSAQATTVVGDGGSYRLSVNPGRAYKLWAVPPPGQAFVRAVVATVMPATSDQTLPNATLPGGFVATSRVVGASAVSDALVQVFCPVTSAACRDASLPIAETLTGADGSFTVTLPMPEVMPQSGQR